MASWTAPWKGDCKGILDGIFEGIADSSLVGSLEGIMEGSLDGSLEGISDDSGDSKGKEVGTAKKHDGLQPLYVLPAPKFSKGSIHSIFTVPFYTSPFAWPIQPAEYTFASHGSGSKLQ
jgi:hypothetical protein